MFPVFIALFQSAPQPFIGLALPPVLAQLALVGLGFALGWWMRGSSGDHRDA